MTNLVVKATDTHQFLDPSSSHPDHCKKKEYHTLQVVRFNRICCDNESLGKRCNELEGWLIERGYNGKNLRKQILRAREDSRKVPRRFLEKEKKEKLPSRNYHLILPTTQFFKTSETYYENTIYYQLLIRNIRSCFLYLLQDFVMLRGQKTTSSELSYLKLMKPGDVNHMGRRPV